MEARMQVAKWGNSLAVRLPKKLVESLGLKAGDEVEIVAAEKGALVLQKNDRRAAALARLASRGWSVPADYRFDRDEANAR
jgi:antitoxin MazE